MTYPVVVKGVTFNLEVTQDGLLHVGRFVDASGAGTVESPSIIDLKLRAEAVLIKYVQRDLRSEHQIRVDKFMNLIPGQRVRREPGELTESERLLRARLMYEEVMETINDGLGVEINGADEFIITGPFDLVKTVDGCFDTMVVTTGTLSACGVPDLRGQRIVDENNLAKFGPGHTIREDGKLVKPPNHKPPDLGQYLRDITRAINS